MDEKTERTILEKEVYFLVDQLHSAGMGVLDTSPKQDGTLDHLTLVDLRQLKRDFRDLLRTIGGARQ